MLLYEKLYSEAFNRGFEEYVIRYYTDIFRGAVPKKVKPLSTKEQLERRMDALIEKYNNGIPKKDSSRVIKSRWMK